MTPGPLLFARYAYPPNALGLCGAEESRTLLEYGTANESDDGLVELAQAFEGAWPYLVLIAGANGIHDPLDPRVVEAYWVGNSLLDGVSSRVLARHIEERFKGRVGRSWERIVDAVAAGAVPHHTFHVFAVYPWLGLLRTGDVAQPLSVLDRCRITPALVEAVEAETVTVLAPSLYWDGKSLTLGPWQRRTARSQADGLGFVAPSVGDWVSLHWDFVCDRLTPAQASMLLRASERALAAANRSTGAASVLG
jgi:Family of unknown function (DUF6390)